MYTARSPPHLSRTSCPACESSYARLGYFRQYIPQLKTPIPSALTSNQGTHQKVRTSHTLSLRCQQKKPLPTSLCLRNKGPSKASATLSPPSHVALPKLAVHSVMAPRLQRPCPVKDVRTWMLRVRYLETPTSAAPSRPTFASASLGQVQRAGGQ